MVHISTNIKLFRLISPVVWIIKIIGRYNPTLIVRVRYFLRFKKRLHLDNPTTLNEKILYQSLRTDVSMRTRLSDKFAVREYVKECGLERILVKLYGVWKDASLIDFSRLPSSFVLKPNHGSGNIVLVNDKTQLDVNKVVKQLNRDLKHTYGELEGGRHYYGIKPVIIAEEMLYNDSESAKYSTSIIDYKIWCFNGEAHYVWTCCNRNDDSTQVMIYDRDWNMRPEFSIFNKYYSKALPLPRPKALDQMLQVAEILSKPFPVVRVDLYNLDGKIYFGEMTFTSLGGLMDFYTDEFQIHAGNLIDLSYEAYH